MVTTNSAARRLGAALIAGGAVFALAACSSGDSGSSLSNPAFQPTLQKPADPEMARSLVLPASAFPAGYEVQEVPADQLQEVSTQILEATRSSKITPSSCAQLNMLPAQIDTSQMGIAVAMKDSSTISNAVVVAQTDLGTQRDSLSGKCENLAVEITDGVAKGATGTVQQKVVQAPKTKADSTLMLTQNTSTQVEGTTVKTTSRMGIAQVNGFQVTVQCMSMTGGAIDDATCDEMFVKAVDYAVDKTS